MIQDPNLKRPSRSRRRKPSVWLPYQGPPLCDLWVTQQVHVDAERSSVRLVKECSTCGRQQYAVDGIERWETEWDSERRESMKRRVPRSRGLGVYIREDALAGNAIFRTHEFPGWTLCTDHVRKLVEKEGFTNVSFLEVGETD
jgi:Immunity protein family (Imm11)